MMTQLRATADIQTMTDFVIWNVYDGQEPKFGVEEEWVRDG